MANLPLYPAFGKLQRCGVANQRIDVVSVFRVGPARGNFPERTQHKKAFTVPWMGYFQVGIQINPAMIAYDIQIDDAV